MKNLKKTSILLTTLIVLSVLVATLSPSIATNYPILEEVFAKDDGNDAFVDSLTENVDYTILLQSRQFVPESGIDPILEKELLKRAEGFHVLIQFNNIPTDTEKKALESFGVELLDYIPNNAWYAYVPDGNTVYDIIARPNVRAIIEILPPDKIAPAIRNYGVGKWATNEDKTVNLQVIFFDDVSKDMAIQIISKYGTVVEEPNLGNVWAITVQSDAIPDLADEDSVQWIDQVPPPKTTNNDGSRAAIKVNTVQSPPYNLNGYGVVIAEWDGGWADNTHNDLKGRVTIGDTGSSVASHATHVAGTAIGDGTNSGGVYRGMATKAKLISYEWPNTISEMDSETSSAINKYGAVISQNSWGWRIDKNNCNLHGVYDTWSQNYDWIVGSKLGKPITVVFSAGNEENDGDCPPYPWDQISGPGGTAKNTIVVGATYSDTNGHTCFSSRGPTDDGRIKPDVSAPGDEANDNPSNPCLYGNKIRSTIPGNSYGEKAGTSMAAPAVSGSAALLYQAYKNTHGSIYPSPSTVKALLIHTSKDLGNTGPDYTYGWGLINVTSAVDVINADKNPTQTIYEDQVTNGQSKTISISVPSGASELKATLVWTDYKGNPAVAKQLVNDLDLSITSGGTTYLPWKLDSSNPSNPATKGVDKTNNVEQVVISKPASGTYTVTVKGTSVPQGPQSYSLIVTGAAGAPTTGANIIYHEDYGAGIWRMNPDGSGNTQLSQHGWFAEYSPDNKKIAFGEFYNNGIWTMDADGTNQVQITKSGSAPTWSPDAKKIAYFVGDTTGTNRRIWVMNADGTNQHQLSKNPGSFPKWAPDGSKIAYHGETNTGVWLINPDGTGETLLLSSGGYPSWSPDSKQIAYVSFRDWCIWIMNADGTNQKKLSKNKGISPSWSADGKKIAYENLTNNKGIWVINTDGTNEHSINRGGHAPDWTSPKPALKPTISIYTDKTNYTKDDIQELGLDVMNPDGAINVSIKIWLETPDGSNYTLIDVPSVALIAGLTYSNPKFKTFTLPPIKPGTYVWHAALDDPATGNIISEDASKWVFS